MKNRIVRVSIITLIVYIFYISVFVEDVVDSSIPQEKHLLENEDRALQMDTIFNHKGIYKIDTLSEEKSSMILDVTKNKTSVE